MSATFYRDLPAAPTFASAVDNNSCSPLPNDWNVLVAAVRCTETAVEQGRYRDVNAVAVACIAAMRNGFSCHEFPAVFGGDVVTFCVPESALENARALLLECQQLARREFDLDLRIGGVPVTLLRELGTDVKVGHFGTAEGQTQVIVTGEGINTAEDLVKGSHQFLIQRSRSSLKANFAGFQSRVSEISASGAENVSLLIRALDPSELERTLAYAHVLQLIESIYGETDSHHPVDAQGPRSGFSPDALRNEARVCNPGFNRIGKAMHLLSVLPQVAARAGVHNTEGSDGMAKPQMRDLSNWRGFDGQLRMVITGTTEQRAKLRGRLSELHYSSRIAFGMHASNSSLITSIVDDSAGSCVHFVDGGAGGYATASIEMKAQLRVLEARQQRIDAEAGESLAAELRRQSANFRKTSDAIGEVQLSNLPFAARENRQERVASAPL